MFDAPLNWILLVALILLSDALLWRAAFLAARRGAVSLPPGHLEQPPAADLSDVEPVADFRQEPQVPAEVLQQLSRLDSRLSEIHQLLKRLSDDAAAQTPAPSSQAEGVLDFAARLAQRGCGVDELVDLCNLGRSEAELVHALHAERSATA